MYCKYCGQQIDDNAQFCPYCGKQLRDANDGSVKQGKNKREKAKKQVAVYDGRGNHKPPTKKDKGVGKTAAIILTAVVLIIFIVALSCLHIIRVPIIEDSANKDAKADQNNTDAGEEISLENYRNESPDAEAYFEQNSQIIEKMNVNDSKDVLTEAEVIGLLEERGFKDYPITTEYSMDGKYHDEAVVSNSSDIKHPIYETYYVSSRNDYWIISVIEDDISNNLIECFNKQFKAWYKTKQGFSSFESANNLISMFVFFFNFVRPHSALNGLTPAQVAGLKIPKRRKREFLLVA